MDIHLTTFGDEKYVALCGAQADYVQLSVKDNSYMFYIDHDDHPDLDDLYKHFGQFLTTFKNQRMPGSTPEEREYFQPCLDCLNNLEMLNGFSQGGWRVYLHRQLDPRETYHVP